MDEPSAPPQVADTGVLGGVRVADLMATLRAALEEVDAERLRQGKKALLALESVDVELHCTVAAASNGDAELRILPAGAWEGVQASAVGKVSLHYKVDEAARREGRTSGRAHSSRSTPPPDDDREPLEVPADDHDAR